MDRFWWEQVGPRRFCNEVMSAVQNTSVAVCFPQFAGEDLLQGCDGIFDRIDCYFDAEDNPEAAVVVRQEIGSSSNDPIDSLLQLKGIVVVRNIKQSTWPSWCPFVESYHRRLSSIKRSGPESARFLLVVKGIPEEKLRPLGVDLKVLLYKGRTGFLDTEQYCTSTLQNKIPFLIEQQVRAAIIAQLAMGDKALADWLCGKDFSAILYPSSTLRKYAEQRRLTSESAPQWHSGTQDEIDGKRLDSSLLLAIRNETDLLNNRVWKAQLKVLFPFIEERRCDFIDVIIDHLPMPKEVSLRESEFANIAWIISNHLKKEDHDTAQIYIDIAKAFGEVRNALAHRNPSSAMQLERMFHASTRLDDLIANGPVKKIRARAAIST